MIYFIQHDTDGPVKIGYTKELGSVLGRLQALQIGNPYPLRVLGVMEGGLDYECALHAHLHEYRLIGEWFEPIPELLEFVRKHALLRVSSPPRNGDERYRYRLIGSKN